LCRWKDFFCKFLGGVIRWLRRFLGENIGFPGQNEVISVFEIGHLWDDGSVNSASYGSRLPDF
jgi:hypothetical protein